MFPFSRRLRSDAVANLLFKDTFRLLADSSAKVLGDHLIHEINSEDPQGNIRFRSEWFSLLAFLVTFSFQRKFLHLGKEKSNLVLDVFHDKLFTYTAGLFYPDYSPWKSDFPISHFNTTFQEVIRSLQFCHSPIEISHSKILNETRFFENPFDFTNYCYAILWHRHCFTF